MEEHLMTLSPCPKKTTCPSNIAPAASNDAITTPAPYTAQRPAPKGYKPPCKEFSRTTAIKDQFMHSTQRATCNELTNLNAALMARRPGPRAQLRLKGRPCNAISDKVNSPIPDATCMQEFKSSIATGELTNASRKA